MLSSLFAKNSFEHGVHPHDHKAQTAHLAVERMPFAKRYVLPLGQHIGAPSKAVVAAGDKVRRGQLLAQPGGYVSTALHSPVTGTVVSVGLKRHPFGQFVNSVEIVADAYSDQQIDPHDPGDPDKMDVPAFVRAVQAAGIVGLGGAAFPSHVKYQLPEGKRCDHFVLNGCECEPFLTCDHRVMLERPVDLLDGVRLVAAKLGAGAISIGVEANKPDAVEALRAATRPDDAIDVRPLHVKYPQGAEKMLIKALFGVEVPAGKLPLDVGMVVNNVGTMVAISDWFRRGQPLIERVLTVAGPGVRRPANLIVPIGTSVREVLDYCGGIDPNARLVVMGGPMMGQPLASLDVPVLKGTSGLLVFLDERAARQEEFPCVRCGRCLEACPYFLNPSLLARLSRAGRTDELREAYALDCVECGSCTFACPSGIPIVQLIRVAKLELRKQKN